MTRHIVRKLVITGFAVTLLAANAEAQSRGGGGGGGRPGGMSGGGGRPGGMSGAAPRGGMSGGHSTSAGSWHGGAGGGQYHGGGYNGGAYHGGNYHGGNYYHNGYHNGGYYGGYRGYPYYGYGYPFGLAIGLGFGSYYSSPYYGSGYYGNGGYSSYAVSAYSPDYSYGQTTSLESFPANPPIERSATAYPLAADKVRMLIIVPTPDVELTINGQATTQQGTDRLFDSPSMEPGKTYVYSLRATWSKDGHQITRKKDIDVETGKTYTIVFKFEAEVAPPPTPKP